MTEENVIIYSLYVRDNLEGKRTRQMASTKIKGDNYLKYIAEEEKSFDENYQKWLYVTDEKGFVICDCSTYSFRFSLDRFKENMKGDE